MADLGITNARLSLLMQATYQNTLTDGDTAEVKQPWLAYTFPLADGIANGQADRGWKVESRTLANGASLTLSLYDFDGFDLGAGAGRDGLGQAAAYDNIAAIAIVNENTSGTAGTLAIEPAAAEGWQGIGEHTGINALAAQGVLLKINLSAAGLPLADGVAHQITLTAAGADVAFSIHVFARAEVASSSSSSSSSAEESSSSSSSSSSAEVADESSSSSSSSSSGVADESSSSSSSSSSGVE